MARDSLPRWITQLFQFLPRGLVDVFSPRGFGHARLIHFLFDASECRLVGFLLRLVLMHTCTMSRVQRDYRSIWNRAGSFRIVALYDNLWVKGPWKTPLRGKVPRRDFPTALGNPATAAGFPLFPPPRLRGVNFPIPPRQEE